MITAKSDKFHSNIIYIFIIGYIWIILMLFIYAGFLYYESNKSIKNTGNAMLNLYVNELDSLLRANEEHLLEMIINNSSSQVLQYGNSEVKRYSAAYELKEEMQAAMSLGPEIAGFVIMYNEGSSCYYTYKDNVPLEDKQIISQFVKNELLEQNSNGQWMNIEGVSQNYLLLTYDIRGVYLSVVVDYETVTADVVSAYAVSDTEIIFADEKHILLNEELAKELGITNAQNTTVKDRSGTKMMFSRQIDKTDLTMILAIPYKSEKVLRISQIMIVLILILVVCCILYSYSYIYKMFIQPINRIYETILEIRKGDVNVRIPVGMRITEYKQMGNSFNEMMDKIEELKIQTYEEQIKEQKARQQYLQLQIKPHFFLNCLKTFYALLQQKKYAKLEDSIIETSQYFRYIFSDNFEMVTVREEIKFTKNYLTLQKNSTDLDVDDSFVVDVNVTEEQIMPLMIQTFVENSIKYAEPKEKLSIKIKVIRLKGNEKDYIDVTVSDNGQGYSEEWLEKINGADYDFADGNHIGILNLKKRLQIRFGEEAEIVVRNRSGAISEIIYPLGKTGDQNEHFSG